MLRIEIPAHPPKSVLPPGGTPANDAAYLAWREETLQRADDQLFAKWWHEALDHVLGMVELRAVFDERLLSALHGTLPLWGAMDRLTYQHRLRFLGIAFRDRRRDVAA